MSIDLTHDLATLPDRLRNRITPTDDGHWIWTGQINNKGYGHVYWKYPAGDPRPADKRPVHVVVYELLVGPIPAGHEIDHLCVTTPCCNPSHTEAVTHAENMRRTGERQTECRRAGHPYTPENTYRLPGSHKKRCRQCARDADSRRTPRRRR